MLVLAVILLIMTLVFSLCGTVSDVCRASVGKPEGKKPPGRRRLGWEDNFTVDLQEVGWGAWTGLIWLRIGTGSGYL
jgi:hypothetical protein